MEITVVYTLIFMHCLLSDEHQVISKRHLVVSFHDSMGSWQKEIEAARTKIVDGAGFRN